MPPKKPPRKKPPRRRRPKQPRRTISRGVSALPVLLGLATAAAIAVAVLSVGSPSAATVSERMVTVSKGVVQSVVSGSGNLSPANQLDVNFGTSGRITKIYVKEGQHVSKDELLARVSSASQRVDLAQAQAQLVDAQDALDKVQSGTSTTSTTSTTSATSTNTAAAATAGTMIAVAAQVTPSPTPSATGTPAASPTPTPTAPRATPTPTPTPRATPTPKPTAPHASPTATPTQSGGSPSGGGGSSSGGGGSSSGGGGSSSGGSSSGSAGGSTVSVESATAAVESAKLAVTEAQDALDATVLRAPAAGTIASIANAVGDTVGTSSSSSSSSSSSGSAAGGAGGTSGGGAASGGSSSSTGSSGFIVLAQLSRLKMEVALSESDIGKVEDGQKATVTINAASGEEVAAHVTSIGVLSSASSSTSGSSAVSYPVVVMLDQTTDGVRAGMSATADIVTSQASGITVPNQALRGTTVTVDRNGKRSTQRVETGVVGDSTTQVVSGLNVGDRVVITSTSALAGSAASGQAGAAPGGLGGGGGGFGGGGGGFGGGGGGFGGGGGGFGGGGGGIRRTG